MATRNLKFHYDPVADILRIDAVPPYAEQESDEISSLVVARRNPTSKVIENIEIIGFRQRLDSGRDIDLPILAEFQAA